MLQIFHLFDLLESLHDLYFLGVEEEASLQVLLRLLVVFEVNMGPSDAVEYLHVVRLDIEDYLAFLDAELVLAQFEEAKRQIFVRR